MRHTKIIKSIIKKYGIRQEDLAYSLNLANQSAMSRRINRINPSIMNTVDILEELGYEMVLRPANKKPLAENEYRLDSSDYEGEE